MANNGVKPPPSFSSFPEVKPAPTFDSFPVAGPSRSASHSETEEERRERKRRKKEKDSRREDKSSSKHRKSLHHNEEGDGKKVRSRHDPDDDRKGKGREKDSKRERRRSRSPSVDVDRSRKSRKATLVYANDEKYYNTLDLVSGETVNTRDDSQDPVHGLPDYKIFSTDRKGDQEIRRYGKLYRGSVPSYRRLGYGNVVGLNGEFKITRESAYTGQGLEVIAGRDNSKGLRLKDRNIQLRITDRNFRRIALAPTKSLQMPSAVSTMPVDEDFVPLPRERSERERLSELEQEEGQDYRSVAGLVDEKAIADDESDDALEAEGGGESYDQYVKRRNREFEQHLRENSTDAKAWLELVAFQDEVHGNFTQDENKSRRRTRTVAERRSISEIKISILERAMEKCDGDPAVHLQLAMMKYGSDIWETAELMKRWQALLRDNPGTMRLWIEYVTFRQTAATVFTVQDTVDVYADCLDRLSRTAQTLPHTSNERAGIEENMVYLLLRVCLLLRQADFPERALAALQAMIELNFQLPDTHREALQSSTAAPQSATAAALDDLEAFWDSEAPRFGEEGAKGWRNTEEGVDPPKGATTVETPAPASTDSDPFTRWHAEEERAAGRRQYPTRTTDDISAEDDDPYSTILFADIRPLLFFVSSPDARSQLLYCFLFYLGLPLTPPDTSTSTPLASDPFLHSDDFASSRHASKRAAFWPSESSDSFLRSLIPFDTIAGEAMEPVRAAGVKDPFQPPFRKFPTSPDLLYQAVPPWFCLLPQGNESSTLDVDLIRQSLAQIRTFSKDIFFTLAYFSFEASIDARSAVKTAKRILKQDSNNLLLWDAYARIELSSGNKTMARTVYANALALAQTLEEKFKTDVPLLWRAWVELEWEDGRLNAALAVLVVSSKAPITKEALDVIAASGSRPGQAALLTAKSHYRQLLGRANSEDAPQALFRHRISITFCSALLACLADDLDTSMTILDKQRMQLRSEGKASAEEEELLAIQAKILFRHTQTKTAFRPGQLRAVLESALEDFPNNSIFLSLHLYNELRTRIENRVRRALDNLVLKEDTVTSEGWLFAMYVELHLNSRTYNAEAVRSLFERAVENTRTKSSVSLWSLFIEFEVKQGRPLRAKTLLQRALVECPWAKDLYVMAFTGNLRSAFRSAELRNIHRLLLEKGIRVHISLDDLVSGWKSEESEDEDMEEAETEDALYAQTLAAERQRLLPI